MNGVSGAVFLSYASQDAEAAKRICEALRAAGVEVWFDQSELRGGDAWDQKIRRQIKECALFVPLISGNTQARPEGYFRLEWHLAEQRSLLIAKGRPFLVPVTVDDTSDRDALVPDAFLAVQWMKAAGGECSPALVADVLRLLAGGAAPRAARPSAPAPAISAAAQPRRPAFPPKLVAVGLLAAVALAAALFLWKPWARNVAAPSVAAKAVPSPEIAALRARIVPDRWQKGDFEAVDATLERLIQQNPENADAWALRSIICSLQTMRLIDRGTKMLQDGRRAAERAMSLAPDAPLSQLALGYHLTANINRGGDPEAGRAPMERAVAELPADGLTRYGALATAWNAYDQPATEARARAWLAAEPTATFPAWILASMNNVARRPADVLEWGEKVTDDPNITGVRAFSTMFDAHYYLRADLAAAAAMLDRVPARGRIVPRIVFCRWLLNSTQGRHDDALQALAAVPDSFIGDVSYAGPKALLAGFSHRWAGRAEAATVQFREAERLLRERLGSDAENEEFRVGLALALAAQDRDTEARNEIALVEPVLRGRLPSLYRGQLFSLVAQVYAALGDAASVSYYLRRIFTEPSHPPHTPASLRQDPRFRAIANTPEIQALFKEFAALDQPAASVAGDKSVAVLAFANLSDDKANEYFSDGISEELLNVLAKVPGLKVSARTSAFYFKGRNTPIPEIARQLGVAYVVEGSVRKAGEKVRITAQLIKAADGFHVWSDTFTRDLKDIFAVQDEIAGLIAQNLQLKMGGAGVATSSGASENYDLILQARHMARQESNEGWRRAIALYRDVLKSTPDAAAAWAGIADAYVQLARFNGMPALPAMNEARAAARRALELAPDDPVALTAMGWVVRTADWNWREARRYFARALEVQPGSAATLSASAILELNLGQKQEALQLAVRAVAADPLNPSAQFTRGVIEYNRGAADIALPFYQRAIALAPTAEEYHCHLAVILALLGRHEEALREIEKEPNEGYRLVAVAHCAALRGDFPAGRAARDALIARHADDFPGYISDVCASLGDNDGALEWFERSIARRDNSVPWFGSSVWQESLRSNPRWQELLRRVGLADDQLK